MRSKNPNGGTHPRLARHLDWVSGTFCRGRETLGLKRVFQKSANILNAEREIPRSPPFSVWILEKTVSDWARERSFPLPGQSVAGCLLSSNAGSARHLTRVWIEAIAGTWGVGDRSTICKSHQQ